MGKKLVKKIGFHLAVVVYYGPMAEKNSRLYAEI
jgi:hypothetical protein